MSPQTVQRIIPVLIALLALTAPVAAQDEAVGPRTAANDAVTLEELFPPDPQSHDATSTGDAAGEQAGPPVGESPPTSAEAPLGQSIPDETIPEEAATPYEPPVQETIPLGAPRGGDIKDARRSEAEGWKERFQSLDPRSNGITRVIGALAIVLGLIVLMRVVFMRSGRLFSGARRPSGVLEVLGRYPIAKGQQLVLIKLARRVLLVHQTGTTMSTLSEVSDPDEVAGLLARIEAGSGGRGKSFQTVLDHYNDDHPETASKRRSEPQVIDLTRRSTARRLFGKSRATA